jgi:membrane protein implicated in regulation of membrane protease activity
MGYQAPKEGVMDYLVVNAYEICLAIGIGYTLIAALLGGFGGHGAHLGAGHGPHFGHGVHHGHADRADSESGEVIFGPLSPLVIAFFLTCFGAVGLLLSWQFHLRTTSLPVALCASFLLAWLLAKMLNTLLGNMQGSSEVRLYALIGNEGEVTVDIPAEGIGEIVYIAMGSRCVAPARSDEHVLIRRFAGIRISRLVGNMFYVTPLIEDQLQHLAAVPTAEATRHAEQPER